MGVIRDVKCAELNEEMEMKAEEDGHIMGGIVISDLLEHLEKWNYP